MTRKTVHSEKEMYAFAASVAKNLKGGEVLALVGDLGAGKTTFAKGIAKALGVKAMVQSPTFLLLKVYPTAKRLQLCHVDAYRIKNERELLAIGLGEQMENPDMVTVIEWADRVPGLIPKNALRFEFTRGMSEDQRVILAK